MVAIQSKAAYKKRLIMETKKNERAGYYLIAVFVVPLLIAIIMYTYRQHLPAIGSVASGQLIHPAQPIEILQIQMNDGTVFDNQQLTSKWTYLVFQSHSCDLNCEASLFKLRQARIATGRDSNRVQIILVHPHEQSFDIEQQIHNRHLVLKIGGLKTLQVEKQVLQPEQLGAGYIYLIDPNGNLMMKYDHKASSRGLLKDIKKLLKISNIG